MLRPSPIVSASSLGVHKVTKGGLDPTWCLSVLPHSFDPVLPEGKNWACSSLSVGLALAHFGVQADCALLHWIGSKLVF